MTRWTITALDTFEQFQALAGEWNDLLRDSQIENIFLRHEWLTEWWRHYGAEFEVWTLVAHDATGALAGIAPLMRTRRGARCVLWMGGAFVSPNHLDFILREKTPELVEAFCAFLLARRGEWDWLDLNKLPAQSPTREWLIAALRARRVFVRSAESARCPFTQLPSSFEAYLQMLGRRTRKDFRQDTRRLASDYPEAMSRRVQTPAELEDVFSAFVALHQARFKERDEPGSFADARFVAFHRAAALRGLEHGTLQLDYLKIGDEYVAIDYAYRLGRTVLGYSATFNLQWAKYSAGIVMLGRTLERAIAEGVQVYDFLEGEEDYKAHWAHNVSADWRVRAISPHWRGGLMWLGWYLPRLIKKISNRLTRRA